MKRTDIIKRFKEIREKLAIEKEVELPKTKNEVLDIDYEAAFKAIISLIDEGEKVNTPIGMFEKQHKEARMARNPRTGDEVEVPERDVLHYQKNSIVKKLFIE